ncbi:hypothetical protein KAU85_04900, partial [Candidatus Bathyarchaeota archaeon]|nr:hypothetical protein [Candidatus Bathyarchaeota archaeon]
SPAIPSVHVSSIIQRVRFEVFTKSHPPHQPVLEKKFILRVLSFIADGKGWILRECAGGCLEIPVCFVCACSVMYE